MKSAFGGRRNEEGRFVLGFNSCGISSVRHMRDPSSYFEWEDHDLYDMLYVGRQ